MVGVPVTAENAEKAVQTADQLLDAIQRLVAPIGEVRSGSLHGAAQAHALVEVAQTLDAVTRLLVAYRETPGPRSTPGIGD
jgi:hypothetical protein